MPDGEAQPLVDALRESDVAELEVLLVLLRAALVVEIECRVEAERRLAAWKPAVRAAKQFYDKVKIVDLEDGSSPQWAVLADALDAIPADLLPGGGA